MTFSSLEMTGSDASAAAVSACLRFCPAILLLRRVGSSDAADEDDDEAADEEDARREDGAG